MTESAVKTWWHPEFYRIEDNPTSKTTQVDDVHLAQPVGFVWFQKPRYRVKAVNKKREDA